jgi:hypothetical protein
MGMKIDGEHYFAAGAAGVGTAITCPQRLQVRSDSSV